MKTKLKHKRHTIWNRWYKEQIYRNNYMTVLDHLAMYNFEMITCFNITPAFIKDIRSNYKYDWQREIFDNITSGHGLSIPPHNNNTLLITRSFLI